MLDKLALLKKWPLLLFSLSRQRYSLLVVCLFLSKGAEKILDRMPWKLAKKNQLGF